MSNIKVMPTVFRGEVTLPPSKSDVHRAIICAALSDLENAQGNEKPGMAVK